KNIPPPRGLQSTMLQILRDYGPPQVLRALILQLPRAAHLSTGTAARKAYTDTLAILEEPVKKAWDQWPF
ncbi:hypothetical protein LCGC14_3003890, partial [marine sediment metagenome]